MATECQHGQLERSCEICERDSEIARLSAALNKIAEISDHCPYDANEASYKLGMVYEIAQHAASA